MSAFVVEFRTVFDNAIRITILSLLMTGKVPFVRFYGELDCFQNSEDYAYYQHIGPPHHV